MPSLCMFPNLLVSMATSQCSPNKKRNDLTMKYFQRGTNHHEEEALRQILERINRIETLQAIVAEREAKNVVPVDARATTSILALPGQKIFLSFPNVDSVP